MQPHPCGNDWSSGYSPLGLQLHCGLCFASVLLQPANAGFQHPGFPTGYYMFDWPEQTHTSPKSTSESEAVAKAEKAVEVVAVAVAVIV